VFLLNLTRHAEMLNLDLAAQLDWSDAAALPATSRAGAINARAKGS
jgi:hypothetical protein